ncbi:MAG: bifunctional 2-polyprenyl-6-hydroxyphenol methylase/3-demethylubiquinol 3-O-methyltransferase UbiG [Methylotetracoccus sp.]|jgi:2-polyprenyl-6-hydroxyphenyl methylase/3-demethylubiquinone-9 3-methyltransferase|nr:bifunctional 2-polyprenyl-6-hydroxyphenol methylase/3-demethylubiquinol 3-O-methyltransferase UbiG [Methylotetracoccus sp.]
MQTGTNVHHGEIEKFGGKAHDWWNPQGELRTLHAVNPLRMQFIRGHADLAGKSIVDVGCGGGILSEALAYAGGDVLGIDLSEEVLQAAESHATETGLAVTYRHISAEDLAAERQAGFDVVTCMEMLEHVPEPESVVRSCARLVKPGGRVFFSTLNRNLKSYLLAIVGAEYVLRMIPRGTHQFETFIRPSELCQWARNAHLDLLGFEGIGYNPLSKQFTLGKDLGVNYLAAFQRAGD